MIFKLLTEHHLEFLSLKGGCRGSSESTYVKMPHCWKSHVAALIVNSLVAASSIMWQLVCGCIMPSLVSWSSGPRREKTCLQGFRQSEFETSLLSYRD